MDEEAFMAAGWLAVNAFFDRGEEHGDKEFDFGVRLAAAERAAGADWYRAETRINKAPAK